MKGAIDHQWRERVSRCSNALTALLSHSAILQQNTVITASSPTGALEALQSLSAHPDMSKWIKFANTSANSHLCAACPVHSDDINLFAVMSSLIGADDAIEERWKTHTITDSDFERLVMLNKESYQLPFLLYAIFLWQKWAEDNNKVPHKDQAQATNQNTCALSTSVGIRKKKSSYPHSYGGASLHAFVTERYTPYSNMFKASVTLLACLFVALLFSGSLYTWRARCDP